MFTEPFDIVGFDVLASSLVEQVSQIGELICYRTSERPYCVSKTHWWALVWRSAHHISLICCKDKHSRTGAETHKFIAAR